MIGSQFGWLSPQPSTKVAINRYIQHGANPNSNAPPKFLYVENGVGTNTAPNIDQPGNSAFVAPIQKAKVAEGDREAGDDAVLHVRYSALDAGETDRREVDERRLRRCASPGWRSPARRAS
jgi:hypothetical protein